MGDPSYYTPPADLATMKQDIADRAYSIKMKGMLITGLFAAIGVGLMMTGALGAATPLIALIAGAGSAIAGLVTLKETKKLQIDEQFLESRMQGGNWWSGYRKEVMGHGGPAPEAPFVGTPNPRDLGRQ